jgi:integrase
MPDYNPRNERVKKAYFRHLKEAGGKADATIDAVRKAISRFEVYTGYRDFATFNREQAIAFKKRLAGSPGARTGQSMAKSTLLATMNALKQFFAWLSCQQGYKSRVITTDIEYLNLPDKETRAAREPRFKSFPTVAQIRATIQSMPDGNEVEMRNRALLAMSILTGARDAALISLRLKHLDLDRRLLIQDPREVKTKRSKRIDTYFFPMGDDFEAIVVDWIRYLREEKHFGLDDPIFPRTRVVVGAEGVFVADGLEPVHWENTQPVRRIFREAFTLSGLPYFRPHSFRDTLAHYGETHAPTIEHFKAWSQNLGHEQITTTLTSYGSMSPHRQGELVRSMAGVEKRASDPRTLVLFNQFLQMVRSNESGARSGCG